MIPVFAVIPPIQLAASLAMGLCSLLSVRWIVAALRSEDLEQGIEWRYDVSRINELRRLDPMYRFFQPVISVFAAANRAAFQESLPEIQREIYAAGLSRFWLAEEYLARAQLIGLLLSPVYAYVFFDWFGAAGLPLTLMAMVMTVWVLRRRLTTRAKNRLREIKRRMPFLLDLLTLLMEAGSTFLAALSQAIDEFEDHPVAEEFGRVLADVNMGKTRTGAFLAMRDRLDDDEVASIVNSILQGEKLGTPLAHIFRAQADVLRIKRTQFAETVAGEAGVNMLLPGILVMISTVLIILGPFGLNYLKFGLAM